MYNKYDQEYINLATRVLEQGTFKGDRTGVGTQSLFGEQMVFNLCNGGFPLLTTKKIYWKAIVHELLWFLSGSTNTKYLEDNGITIWREWQDKNGDLGPIYSKQWRDFGGFKHRLAEGQNSSVDLNFPGVDQITNLIERIKDKPNDRRLIVSAWNPQDVPDMALPPCHCFFQCYVRDGVLDLQMYQRSADLFLGVPFNIASYCLLLMMIAQVTGLKPGRFIHTFGDVHIYNNHRDQIQEQITREPYKEARVSLNPNIKNIFDFKFEDIALEEYTSHPTIKAEVAV